jgi:hypothetical protein
VLTIWDRYTENSCTVWVIVLFCPRCPPLCLGWGGAHLYPDLIDSNPSQLNVGQMAQIPNLDNAPLNLAALRWIVSFARLLLCVTHLDSDSLIRFVCREQSQKDLFGILKNVGFLSHTARYDHDLRWSCWYWTEEFGFLCDAHQIRGKKCLVIDPKLAGTLSLVVQTSLLKVWLHCVYANLEWLSSLITLCCSNILC